MPRRTTFFVLFAVAISISRAAYSQVVPFIAPGVTAFDPQISVLTTGSLNDVEANVSHDRKYVTINERADNSALLSLQPFAFQRSGGGGGVVGSTTMTTSAG